MAMGSGLMDEPKTDAAEMDTKQESYVGSRPSSPGEMDIGEVKNEPLWRSWARMLSIEVGGIQRVTEEERKQNTTHVWNACTFW